MIFSFLKPIELARYHYYKNRDILQFVTIHNFIFHKCGRSSELQKYGNETLSASFQISPAIFLGAKCPIYSSAHSG